MDAGGGGGTDANNGTGAGQSFNATVEPILQRDGCTGCHTAGGASTPDLTKYNTAMSVLTKPSSSALIITITPVGQTHEGVATYLSAADEATIKNWIDNVQ